MVIWRNELLEDEKAVTMGYTVIMILRRPHNDKTITSVNISKKGRKEKPAIPNVVEDSCRPGGTG